MSTSPLKRVKSGTWEQIITELNDRSQMEELRPYLKTFGIFPRDADPELTPVKIEHLQKLARHWKLHHRRGFWRDHPTLSTLAHALYTHHITLDTTDARAKAARAAFMKSANSEGKEGGSGGPGGDHDADAGSSSGSTLRRDPSAPMFSYVGDKFGTRGDYMDGTLYRSRIVLPGQPTSAAARHKAAAASASASATTASEPSDRAVPATVQEDDEGVMDDDEEEEVGEELFIMDSTETTRNCALVGVRRRGRSGVGVCSPLGGGVSVV